MEINHFMYWLSAVNGADGIRREYYFRGLGQMRYFWHEHSKQLCQPQFWRLGLDDFTHTLTSELLDKI